jgi:uncharacterized protein (DUF1330 family)
MNPLKRNLTKTISVEIIPAGRGNLATDRIWAINWFNYKIKWLYTLYNLLAAPHVIKMGGRLLFKGHLQRQLSGDKELARQTLLIVTYPKIDNFLEMLTIKAFQIKSLLRVKSVKGFVFGFTRRIDKNDTALPQKYSGHNSYLVYHYIGSIESEPLYELARENRVKVFFHGEKIAQLKRIEEGKEDALAPFFMDGIMVFEAENEDAIDNFTAKEGVSQIISPQRGSFAGIFSRDK